MQPKYSSLHSGDEKMPRTGNSASYKRLRMLRVKFTSRSFIFLLLSGLTIALFKVLQDKQGFSPYWKTAFNALWIYLSLGLGGSTMAAFGDIAQVVKWKILASGKSTLVQVNLILRLSDPKSFSKLASASFKSRRFLLSLACFAWILVLLVTQVCVGLLGTFYEMNTVAMVHFTHGLVNITDMRNFYPDSHRDKGIEPEYSVQQSMAHFYGDMATNFPFGMPGISDYREYLLPEPYPNTNSTQWIYYFQEAYSYERLGGGFIHLGGKTNRSVKITPQCEYCPIVGGQYSGMEDTNITISMGGKNVTIDWILDWPTAATTYLNPSGGSSATKTCGPRCSRIYIFQSVDKTWNPPSSTGSFFNCTITVSQVQNANPRQPLHSMPDRTAVTAAGAIGLDGYSEHNSRQFVRYRNSSSWGQRLGDSTHLAELFVGKYAAGVIAAYDFYGPSVEVMGLQSRLETNLSVEWLALIVTLGCIFGVQLMGWVLAFCYHDSVPYDDDSQLATAKFLKPLLEHVETSGSTSTGHKTSLRVTPLVSYSLRPDPSNGRRIYSLDVTED
ncbi:hypothetical protein B9Z19DRAFT_1164498 [Tuber borchii]|uniref:Uncharacterized protein n=1 Tax=Tuber borchii TaxID=42251 RepID=A0A2T6ZCI8_TUBBO|nr:hypothetical protein B9Z19DRAFT_1164498 [Tuber borchii]